MVLVKSLFLEVAIMPLLLCGTGLTRVYVAVIVLELRFSLICFVVDSVVYISHIAIAELLLMVAEGSFTASWIQRHGFLM